jgi:hypothetical protein
MRIRTAAVSAGIAVLANRRSRRARPGGLATDHRRPRDLNDLRLQLPRAQHVHRHGPAVRT